jgi:hypothetical protein
MGYTATLTLGLGRSLSTFLTWDAVAGVLPAIGDAQPLSTEQVDAAGT